MDNLFIYVIYYDPILFINVSLKVFLKTDLKIRCFVNPKLNR